MKSIRRNFQSMKTTRLEAFSDGVIAILITIMVLELKVPHASDWGVLRTLWPVFLSYVLSFIYLGIYWNNHHHMFHVTEKVSGKVLWANHILLFFLSLVPFATAWMGENHFQPNPTAFYGLMLLGCGVAYNRLQAALIAAEGAEQSKLAWAIGPDHKGKYSTLAYSVAIVIAFFAPWVACAIYFGVALMWLMPDRRIEEKVLESTER